MPLRPNLPSDTVDAAIRGLLAGTAVAVMVFPVAVSSGLVGELIRRPVHVQQLVQTELTAARYAEFGDFLPSAQARHVADWVADSSDNAGSDFIVVDKKAAAVLVFDQRARLRASSPILLGGAEGDDTVPGIGSRPLDQILPEERTTPAGRFVGERGRNARGEDVVWVDYDAAVSMHRVLTVNPAERRLERLASESVEDNRVSWGCINVPVAFFETYVSPLFARRQALIYVLPEVKTAQSVFGSYDVQAHRAKQGARNIRQMAWP
jgi:hypothetical protein